MYNCDGVRRLEVDITMCSISYVRKTKNLQTSTFEDLRFEDPQTRILVWNLCQLSSAQLSSALLNSPIKRVCRRVQGGSVPLKERRDVR